MTARSIMVLGTASHVGKSLVTAALCRIFARTGCRVAPFKAQNMSLNSAATPDGCEIGRAQAFQAEAAGVAPSVHMNPILIKPENDTGAQIVARGKVWRRLEAREYLETGIVSLLPLVEESYRTLAENSDVIVLEGAGSPAEINLRDRDIVNLRMARIAGARCLLVGDIDRGGVFASLLGTLELLEPNERAMIDGFLINKFRGDATLLQPGIAIIEARLGIPCLGVIPHIAGLALDEEDSVALETADAAPWPEEHGASRRLRIGVLAFPSLSNFTDFAALAAEPTVAVRYLRDAQQVVGADVLLLPGSKQTASDLGWLRRRGFEEALHRHLREGGLVMGICGGFQMLGHEILDPHGSEHAGIHGGLKLLPVRTIMARDKVTMLARGALTGDSLFGFPVARNEVSGYEIHMGETEYFKGAQSFATISRRGDTAQPLSDGCVSACSRIVGTYLHGIFDGDSFRHEFVRAARAARQLSPPAALAEWSAQRRRQIDRLADVVATSLNLNALFSLVGLPESAISSALRPDATHRVACMTL